MKKKLLLLFLFFSAISAFSQDSIKATIKGYENNQILFSSLYGHLETPIDTLETNSNGYFEYKLGDNFSKGLYRLNFKNQEYIDVIVNGEHIHFTTVIQTPIDSIEIIKSLENKIYYDFYKSSQQNQYKIELLTPLLKYYPKEDSFHKDIIQKFKAIQSEIISKIEFIKKTHGKTFASKLIASDRDPLLYWDPEVIDQDTYLKNHFLDFVDFDDIDLLNSDVLPAKAIQYISIFGNKNLDNNAQGEEFIKAIDNILAEASINKIVFDYILEYLIEGFERFGFENVMTHLSENYITEESCKDDRDKEKLKKRIELYKKFSIGKVAPDFKIKNPNGEKVALSSIDSDYTLLVFWAGWCSHCKETLPKIIALYDLQENEKMKVVAISLDKKKEVWIDAIKDFPESWINISELKGWDSPIADTYNIFATPTFMLLDREKKIVQKPENARELEKFMIEKNIFF